MAKKPSLFHQARLELEAKYAFGQSKHDAKKTGDNVNWIYSHSTAKNYLDVSKQFTDWAKANHGVKTLAEARAVAPDYLRHRIDRGLSAWTVARDGAALGKLYGCSKNDFGVKLPERKRENLIRSRKTDTVRAGRYKPEKHKDIEAFSHATGLRRSEAGNLCVRAIKAEEGTFKIDIKGKGGRVRWVKAFDPEAVAEILERAKGNPEALLFEKLPSDMDLHANRAEFAQRLYEEHARDISTLSKKEKYFCRGDKLGTVYDRRAMAIVSKALGHDRLNVIASSYLDKVYK